MKVMDHPLFRRFWYPVMPLEDLKAGPRRFELLGEGLALFLDAEGRPAALEDRCCHRSARLSLGRVEGGILACGYHGWEYDRTGQCVRMPQVPGQKPGPQRRVRAFRCEARYGYAWVALEEPLYEIPRIPEAEQPGWRLVHEFYEVWNVAALRVMENELDMAHPSFVHLGTFGTPEHLVAKDAVIEEFEGGFHYRGRLGVAIAHHAQAAPNERRLDCTWYAPFAVRLGIHYADGPGHVVVNIQVPVADNRSHMVQFCLIEDRDGKADVAKILDFDRRVTLEDKRILESTDPDIPLDLKSEQHMPSDQPGIAMRRILKRLIESDSSAREAGAPPPSSP
jgi:phenylpropionate dioxygenase-like ring-hydroxylating dioxygenase large terminal subunit